MRTPILFIFFIASLSDLYGQSESIDWAGYMKRIQSADSLFQLAKYHHSSRAFSEAFSYSNQAFMAGHRYQAARAWALSEQNDSAFHNLEIEATSNFYDYKKLASDSAFQSLRSAPRWDSILKTVKLNYDAEMRKAGRFTGVRIRLEEINDLDQQYRSEYMRSWQTMGKNSAEAKNILKKMELQDRKNLSEVEKILNEYGWIGFDSIGVKANQTLFLVIQHSDIKTQIRYLPLLKKAVAEKNAHGHQLALLEDRVLIGTGKKQLYGSQIDCDSTGTNCKLFPIEDEKNVDARRAAMGLEPLAQYVRYWNIIYKKPE